MTSEESPAASASSWKHKPPPSQRAALDYPRRFSAAEHARLLRGLVPRQLDDKWFVFVEAGWMLLHRAYTGACIYGVRLEPDPATGGSIAAEAWVSRAREEYTRTDDAYDARLLAYLVDGLLLGLDAAFPVPDAIVGGDRASLYRNHVVGQGRSGKDGA